MHGIIPFSSSFGFSTTYIMRGEASVDGLEGDAFTLGVLDLLQEFLASWCRVLERRENEVSFHRTRRGFLRGSIAFFFSFFHFNYVKVVFGRQGRLCDFGVTDSAEKENVFLGHGCKVNEEEWRRMRELERRGMRVVAERERKDSDPLPRPNLFLCFFIRWQRPF